MMSIEKVYDELYGMIEDLKKQIAAGSGTDVTITPALESGTKIADYSIDGTEGALYTPTIPAIPDEFIIESGVSHKIGKYGNEDLYCAEVSIAALPNTASTGEYNIGIANISNIVLSVMTITYSNGHKTTIPMFGFSGDSVYGTTAITAEIDTSKVYIKVGSDRSAVSATVLILFTITPPEEAKKTTKRK